MIEIASGEMKAVLAPAHGGVVLSLRQGERNLLRSAHSEAEAAADPRTAACYPIVPWFSRLPGGLSHGGRHYELGPTLPACDPVHALHGHGWVNPWTVTEQTRDTLACRFDHAPARLSFPFPFSATQRFAVTEDGLQIDLAVTNMGAAPMPAGLGLHPFFPHHANSAVSFAREAIAIGEQSRDDSFQEWGGCAVIKQADGALTLISDAPILHVYAPPDEPYFCAEPVTHLPGRFGEKRLDPKKTLKIFLKILKS